MTSRTIQGIVLRHDDSPYRDTRVEVWDRDFLIDDQIGFEVTDNEGKFNISYDTNDAGDKPDLTLRVFRLNASGEFELIFDRDGDNNVDVALYDFGEIRIIDWEYDDKYSVPLILTNDSGINSSPQDFVRAQKDKIYFNAVKFGAMQLAANLAIDISGVQAAFPSTLTIENKDSRSDKFFVDAILNGFAPAMFTLDKSGNYHLRYSIDEYDWDKVHQSPNVHLILSKDGSNNLVPKEISWSIRANDTKPLCTGSA